MEKASSQIEGITCALAVYIENTADVVREYHYQVYNDFVNDVRDKQIEAIKTIKDIFCDTRTSIENMAASICASSSSKAELALKLVEFEDKLGRLVIHSENIRKCESSTENPIIADASDDIYRSFAGYKRLIDEYPLSEPYESEDAVSNLIYSYFNESIRIYEDLFVEYDKMLSYMGGELEVRRSALTRKSIFYKGGDKLGTAMTVGKAVSDTTGVINKVRKGNIFSATDRAIGICATLAEKFIEVVPKDSVARNMMDGIVTIGKTMELVESMLNVVEPELKKSEGFSAVKLFTAGSMLQNNGLNIQQMKESGKLDVLINAAGLTSNVVKIATTGNAPERILNLPKTVESGFGLYKAILNYYHKNNVQITPRPINDFLNNQARKLKKYNKSIEEYKQKVIKKIPAKIPKAPPWMLVHSGVKLTDMVLDKAMEKGGVIYDYAKEIL